MMFSDFSLVFEIVYFVESADLKLHMDKQQEILIEMYEAFEKAGIEFAFPTQTLQIEKKAWLTGNRLAYKKAAIPKRIAAFLKNDQ